MAGAIERAGFMEAPEMVPPTMMSKMMVPPMARPARMPVSLGPLVVERMTKKRKKVRMISKTKAWETE